MSICYHWKWKLLKGMIRLQFPQVTPLSTAELAAWLADEDRPNPLLLDTRSPLEYAISHLKQAHWTVSTSQGIINLPPVSRVTPIVTYCSVGYRSARVAGQLQEMGYKQVFNLEGSLFAWFSEDRPVYQEGQPVSQIHPYNRFWAIWL